MNSPLGRLTNVNPPHYQDLMADLIRAEKPFSVIETGLNDGFGAEYILKALDDNGKGHLWSVDPLDPTHKANETYWSPDIMLTNPIVHPRFTWVRKFSHEALKDLFVQIGPWDVFIHDSDHSFECQAFEYEAAWNYVRVGGIIASDDTTWGNPHHAWQKFCSRHNVNPIKLGNAEYFKHP